MVECNVLYGNLRSYQQQLLTVCFLCTQARCQEEHGGVGVKTVFFLCDILFVLREVQVLRPQKNTAILHHILA